MMIQVRIKLISSLLILLNNNYLYHLNAFKVTEEQFENAMIHNKYSYTNSKLHETFVYWSVLFGVERKEAAMLLAQILYESKGFTISQDEGKLNHDKSNTSHCEF